MDLRPKFRADSFIYPAEHKDIMKIQEEVQKKLDGKDLEKDLDGLKDYEKANAILIPIRFSFMGLVSKSTLLAK